MSRPNDESTPATAPPTPMVPTAGMLCALSGAVVAAFVLVWLVGLDLAVRPPLPARIQADDVTGLVSLLSDLTARLAALTTLGALAGLVAFTPQGPGYAVTEAGQRLTRIAGRAAQVWFWAAILNTFANPAYVNGVPIGYTMRPDAWWAFVTATPSGLAWLTSAVVAGAIVAACYLSRATGTFVLLLAAGVVADAFVAATGNVSVGLNHDWATDAAIIGSLAVVPLGAAAVGVLLRGTARVESIVGDAGEGSSVSVDAQTATTARVRRYHHMVLPLVAVAACAHLIIAWQQLAGEPVTSQFYGLPTIGFFVVFGLLLLSWIVRQTTGELHGSAVRAVWSIARDVVLFVAYVAFRTVENHIPPPRFLEPQTIQINYLGYEVALPPTLERLLAFGRPNLLWVAIVVAALGSYVWAMVRVRRNGDHWPVARLIAWIAGWLLTGYLAVSGLWEYSTVTYSWHMVVHMTVNMLVPVLCLLGAPISLARAASRPAPGWASFGEVIDAVEDHRPWQRLTSPLVAWLVYVSGLFLVYFTPLFPWLMKYHWAHQLMLLFFMVTGYLFFDHIIGVDRTAWRLPHLLKLALVISIMPFHAVFAVGILSSRNLIGAPFYETIAMPWMTDLMADQNIAGQATWLLGEVPLFIVMIALAAQWFRSDSSEAVAIDRATDSGEDDSFEAYNQMLAELAERDRATQTNPPRIDR